MYKMTVYDADGRMFRIERAKNLEWFDRYKFSLCIAKRTKRNRG